MADLSTTPRQDQDDNTLNLIFPPTPRKLSPIFRKIQKYLPTLVFSTIQLRYGAKLYAALESI